MDVVVSDASPRFTGVRDVDISRQIELTEKSYNISLKLVKRGGSIMLKALECRELQLLEEQLRTSFNYVKRFIPSATRKTSSEIYLVGLKRY